MENKAITLYKLIILFVLDKLGFPLSNAELSGLLLEKEYASNYFSVQQAVSQLEESGLLRRSSTRKSSFLQITPEGSETLRMFGHEIPRAIREEILAYLKERRYELREEISTLSDYRMTRKGEYVARCLVRDGESDVIDLSLSVPTEEEAAAICEHWKEKSQEVYAYLMKTLM